jgi:hypothetical protein
MGTRLGSKTTNKDSDPEETVQDVVGQRKRPEAGQFHLQVDRQTKGSYTTYEAAEQAGMAIKKSHPVVQVAVYDVIASVSKIIEMPKV